jgi:hypothetical protein
MEKETFSIESFKNIQQLIVFLHNKAYALLVIDGFLISVFMSLAKDEVFVDFYSITLLNMLSFFLGLFFILLMAFQFYYVLYKIIKPNLASNYNKDDYSLFYFEHIANASKEEFLEKLNKINNEELLNVISAQVYEVSKIMTSKTKKLIKAIRFLFIGIIVLILYALIIKIM